jgi:DNA-binding CsgD family transcriptional regulator
MTELDVLEHVTELCATSASASELCRKLVHSPRLGEEALGASMYLITQSGDLDLIGNYGNQHEIGDQTSIWSDHPIAVAGRTQQPQFAEVDANNGNRVSLGAIPVLKGHEPIGVAVMLKATPDHMHTDKLGTSAMKVLGNTYGIWMDSLGLKPATGPITTASANDLTEPQSDILRQMAQGKTNAQIAAEMILSESSIRQETVRIYRALGVGTRAEAARKGLNLGLIDKVTI